MCDARVKILNLAHISHRRNRPFGGGYIPFSYVDLERSDAAKIDFPGPAVVEKEGRWLSCERLYTDVQRYATHKPGCQNDMH